MRFYKQRLEILRKLRELDNREDLNIAELELKKAIKGIIEVDFFLPIISSKSSETSVIFLGSLGAN